MGYRFRPSAHPAASLVWQMEAEETGTYTDAANEFWGLAFGRSSDGTPTAHLIGPTLHPRQMHIQRGEVAWGAELRAHVFVRGVSKSALLGDIVELPSDGRFVELAGSRFPVPSYDGLEDFLSTLLGQGILAADDLIAAALAGEDPAYSSRQLRRRTTSSVGIPPTSIGQQRRARHAYALLQQGSSVAQAAVEAGYSDQAHMTRAFVALAGITPARLLAAAPEGDAFASRPPDR